MSRSWAWHGIIFDKTTKWCCGPCALQPRTGYPSVIWMMLTTSVLPSIQDWRNLQKRMECVVQNIVQKNFPQFSEAHVATIQHQYSDISEDGTERQEMFEDICKRVVQLVWPKIDMKSIQQAAEGDVVQDSDSDDDPQYLDDTILYWNDQTQDELEETLPYWSSRPKQWWFCVSV